MSAGSGTSHRRAVVFALAFLAACRQAPRTVEEARAADDAANAASFWVAVAWPVEYGVTGLRAFAITEHGDVLWTRNGAHFSGRQKPMPPTAALRADANGTLRGPYTVNDVAADGSAWGIIQ